MESKDLCVAELLPSFLDILACLWRFIDKLGIQPDSNERLQVQHQLQHPARAEFARISWLVSAAGDTGCGESTWAE